MTNNKINEFKLFIKANPFLINYIKTGTSNWQDLYEIYDIFGEDEDIWNNYLKDTQTKEESTEKTKNLTSHIDDLIKMAKKVDVDKVQEGITSLQKTLSLFGDLFAGSNTNTKKYNPRPLYRRFED